MEPLQEAILKEFCERLAASDAFAEVDVARLRETLCGEGKPKAEDIIAVLSKAGDVVGEAEDDPH